METGPDGAYRSKESYGLIPQDPGARYEERLVHYLLDRYGLMDTRTRFLMMDLDNRRLAGDDRSRLLQLGWFNEFFPKFPVRLRAVYLTEARSSSINAEELIWGLEGTILYREFFEWRDDYNTEHDWCAVVFRWPYKVGGNSLTLHNVLHLNINVPGPHYVWSAADGNRLVLQPLASMLDILDNMVPPKSWLKSARDPDYMERVEPRSQAKRRRK